MGIHFFSNVGIQFALQKLLVAFALEGCMTITEISL